MMNLKKVMYVILNKFKKYIYIKMADRISQFTKVQKEALELFTKKNKDYGDAFAEFGTIGVIMRMRDKLSRYINISNLSIQLVDDEGIRDTLIDLHNYTAMAIMLLDEKSNK